MGIEEKEEVTGMPENCIVTAITMEGYLCYPLIQFFFILSYFTTRFSSLQRRTHEHGVELVQKRRAGTTDYGLPRLQGQFFAIYGIGART